MAESDIDAVAFRGAQLAAPDAPVDQLRLAIDRYLELLHIHVSHIHFEEQALTPDQVLDAFRPRTIEF